MLRSDESFLSRGSAEASVAQRIVESIDPDTVELADVGADLAHHYLSLLVNVVTTGRPVSDKAVETLRELGARAALKGVDLTSLLRVSGACARAVGERLAEAELPVAPSYRGTTGQMHLTSTILETSELALSMLTTGHQDGLQRTIASDTSSREQFVQQLVTGSGDMQRLVSDAERMGFHPAMSHFVALLRMDDQVCSARIAAWLDAALRARLDDAEAAVTTHGGDVIAVCGGRTDTARAFEDVMCCVLKEAFGDDAQWRAAIGRPRRGLRGVQQSYQDAADGLELGRLVSGAKVIRIDQLLLARVLGRDRGAMADLIRSVLMPLTEAKNGAEPLLDTLSAYFRACCVTTEAAKALYLSVRAVSYRLCRIKALTGYDVDVPIERLTLQVATAGARLLDWPATPLPDND